MSLTLKTKKKTIHKINQQRKDQPPTEKSLPLKIYVRNKQKQSKLKNLYKPEELLKINKNLKTRYIKPQRYNTKQKIHLSNAIHRDTHPLILEDPLLRKIDR